MSTPKPDNGTAKVNPRSTPPRADARRLSVSPAGDAALYAANASDGSRLWIGGGSVRTMTDFAELWRGNEWVGEIETGRSELVSYKGTDGTPLNAWLLLPPRAVEGTHLPMVTIIYPSQVYGTDVPSSFSLFQTHSNTRSFWRRSGTPCFFPACRNRGTRRLRMSWNRYPRV